jgi:hypothetical protein
LCADGREFDKSLIITVMSNRVCLTQVWVTSMDTSHLIQTLMKMVKTGHSDKYTSSP